MVNNNNNSFRPFYSFWQKFYSCFLKFISEAEIPIISVSANRLTRNVYFPELIFPVRRFSRVVIGAMLVDENKLKDLSLAPFVRPPEAVHFSVVIGVSRGWLETSYIVYHFQIIWPNMGDQLINVIFSLNCQSLCRVS